MENKSQRGLEILSIFRRICFKTYLGFYSLGHTANIPSYPTFAHGHYPLRSAGYAIGFNRKFKVLFSIVKKRHLREISKKNWNSRRIRKNFGVIIGNDGKIVRSLKVILVLVRKLRNNLTEMLSFGNVWRNFRKILMWFKENFGKKCSSKCPDCLSDSVPRHFHIISNKWLTPPTSIDGLLGSQSYRNTSLGKVS